MNRKKVNSQSRFLLRRRRADQLAEIRRSEKLPPADQAAKYLEQLENTARKNIVARGDIPGNTIKGKYVAFTDDLQLIGRTTIHIHIRFQVNDREFNIVEKIDYANIKNDINLLLAAKSHVKAAIVQWVRDQLAYFVYRELFEPTLIDRNYIL